MEATDADGEEEKVATDLARTGTSVSYCIYSSIHSFVYSFVLSHSFKFYFRNFEMIIFSEFSFFPSLQYSQREDQVRWLQCQVVMT